MYASTPLFDLRFSGDGPVDRTVGYTDAMSSTAMYSNSSYRDMDDYPSEACAAFFKEQRENISFATDVHDSPIRLTIASFTFVENLFVVIALLNSWKCLRQNIYIFALSICCSDCLLGLTHVINSLAVRASTNNQEVLRNTAINQIGPTSWFFTIRATALVTAQVSSTCNAACLVIAFKRYVDVMAPGGSSRNPSRSSETYEETSRSHLLSRKTSYALTGAVWCISILFGIIPLFWNCNKKCACFMNAGVDPTEPEVVNCYKAYGCSYLFPPLKSKWYLLGLSLFFFTLIVLVVACVQVIMAAGGLIAFLPYRLHKYYARRRKTLDEEIDDIPRRLRKRSVQMSYMRDMMRFMIILSASFAVFKLPSAILLFTESVTTERLNISTEWVNRVVLISYADSIINPIIFTTTLHGMKEALKKLVEPCCTKTISVSIGKQLHSREEPRSPQSTTATCV